MSEKELRELLREAGAWMIADPKLNKDYAKRVLELHGRITAALATEPPDGEWGFCHQCGCDNCEAVRAEKEADDAE